MGINMGMGMEMGKSLVDERGRITLPADLRESLSIAPGDEVLVERSGSSILIRHVLSKREIFAKLKGCITEKNEAEKVDPMTLKKVFNASD